MVKRQKPARDTTFQADREPERRDFVSRLLVAERPAALAEPLLAAGDDSAILTEAVDEEGLAEAVENVAPDHNRDDDETCIDPEEVEQLVSDAYQRGKRLGISEGREQMKNDFDAATTVMLNIGQELDSLRQTILENSRGELEALALAIAEKITRRSVKEQHETIIRTVEEAIRLAILSEEITVLVNPADYQAVLAKSDEMKAGVTGLRTVSIRADESIEQGGCRLESDNCIVDATMAGQLADVALALQLDAQS